MIKEESPDQRDISRSLAGSNSTLSDAYIRGREFLLNKLARAGDSQVINRNLVNHGMSPSLDLAERLKQTLVDLRVSVMYESGSKIDYEALRASPAYAAYHQECLAVLDRFNPEDLKTEEAFRAFWINLYNALVLDAVITFGVRQSVTEGRLGMMAFFRRAAYSVDGKRVSLEDIEHGILRANRGNPYVPGVHFPSGDRRLDWALPLDPRIHFALNCGGRSCPPIRSYSPEKLDEQLDVAARSFVDGTVEIQPKNNEVLLSQIFRWYEKDFGGRDGVLDFLTSYLPNDHRREFLETSKSYLRLRHEPYDWGLNVM